MLYTDALVSTTYDASVAGLSWGLAPSADGIKLTVSGYSDKLILLLQKVRACCTPRVHARVTEVSPGDGADGDVPAREPPVHVGQGEPLQGGQGRTPPRA